MDILEIKQNKVKSLFQFAVPATIGMLMSSLITIVDGYFAGNCIGSQALAAINLGLPVLYLYLAVGLMIGVGGSVIAGIAIGSGDEKCANETFSQTMLLTLAVGVGLSVIMAVLFEPILSIFDASDEVKNLYRLYYRVFLFSAPLMVIDSCYGMFLRADGEPQIYMLFNSVAIILNALLDYVFTARLGMGIRGLIFASLTALSCSVTVSTLFFTFRKGGHHLLHFCRFRFNRETITQTFFNGSSEGIGELASCISMFCYNFVLLKYAGEQGVAAFTILGYSVFVFNMICIGFGEGMCPLVSFCYGAGVKSLCKDLRQITNRIIFVVGAVFAVSLFFGGRIYCSFFVQEEAVIKMVSRGFKLFALEFLLQGFNVTGSMYFTSMAKPKQSAVIAMLRGIVILLIAIFVFPFLWGIDGIWLTSPVTEVLTLIATVIFCIKDDLLLQKKSGDTFQNEVNSRNMMNNNLYGGFDKLNHHNQNIIIKGLRQNNLKNVSLEIPKNKIVVFTGVSGSGKSSIVFDTIAAESQRQMNETYSAYVRGRLPKYEKPHVDFIDNLTASVIIDQSRLGGNARSTVGTISDMYSALRLLFSRIGEPKIGPASFFSFNNPNGMCPVCMGIGKVMELDIMKAIDVDKSWNDGMLNLAAFGPGNWYFKQYTSTGWWDLDKKFCDYSDEEKNRLLYGHRLGLAAKGERENKKIEGIKYQFERLCLMKGPEEQTDATLRRLNAYMHEETCSCCDGKRLNEAALSSRVLGYNIHEMCEMEFTKLREVLGMITDERVSTMVEALCASLDRMIDIGLPYLFMNRESSTLSGGEAQRLKLVRYMGSSLTGMTYIFDEPSTGMHPRDVHRMCRLLKSLRDKGNTVLVVEHDKDIIEIADEVVDVGPLAGKNGGQILFQGSYEALLASGTKTGNAMKEVVRVKDAPRVPGGWLSVRGASLHNLKNVDVDIPTGILTCVTGVAGSGKSSLIRDVFAKQFADKVVLVDQSAITATGRSTACTYLGFFDEVRELFAAANKADAGLFSFNGKGKCPCCKGRGVIVTELVFMDPVTTVCEECEGKRYSKAALNKKYHGKNIVELLDMSVEDALEFFKEIAAVVEPVETSSAETKSLQKIIHHLNALMEVGLPYLSLGQPLSTLSGGERQRVKLAKDLNKKGSIFILDEPTTGLHASDIKSIMALLEGFVERGNTVIVIEHNTDVMKMADYIIDVGPDGGTAGGQIVFTGTPAQMIESAETITAKYLRK